VSCCFRNARRVRRGEQRDRDVLLSDLVAGRQALRHHAEGEQDWTTMAMTNRAWQDGSSLSHASSDASLTATAFHAKG
jgi:CHAD domain-containing protein